VLIAISASADLKTFLANGNPKAFSLVGFLQSITLTQAWGYDWQGFSWNGVSWTLSAEWLDYLAFPFLIFAIRGIKSPGVNLLLGCMTLTALGFILKKAGLIDVNATHFSGIGRAIFGFTAGCFLCRFYMGFRQTFPAALACSAGLLFITLSFSSPIASPFIYLAFGTLILSLAYMPKFYGTLFGRGVSFWLGKISFSFYLTHLMVLNITVWILKTEGWNKNPVLNGVLTAFAVILCFAIAMFCYEAIERPSHRIARKIALKPSSSPATAIGALQEMCEYEPEGAMVETEAESSRRAG
jgi:peptidoglycan/LPS O-acetylase OafA/YrhL